MSIKLTLFHFHQSIAIGKKHWYIISKIDEKYLQLKYMDCSEEFDRLHCCEWRNVTNENERVAVSVINVKK